MNKNIGILFSSYGPYHIARLESISAYSPSSEYQVVGIELARSVKKYPWKVNLDNLVFPLISLVRDRDLERTNFKDLIQKLIKTLNQINPELLAISGYFKPSLLMALFWCLSTKKPAILLSESTEEDAQRIWWKEKIKSLIVSRFKCALVGGMPQKRYLMKLGMPESAIFLGYDVVGNDTFHPEKISNLSSPCTKPFFFTINRFIAKKNIPSIISAYAQYRQQIGQDAWDLVLCGDGELRPQIEQQIAKFALQNVIHLPGFLQQEELLPYFAHASCFIHGSTHEQWGLVVNEAMAAGLPVIVSNRCGCFEDLVIEGVNGFGFEPTNIEALANLMLEMSSGNVDRAKMGQAALEHIQKFSPEYFATGLIQAVKYAVA